MKMAIITITVYANSGNSASEAENRNASNDEQSSNNNRKTTRNPYVDIFVAVITVPTLILLALLLDANIQDSISSPTDTRSSFIVLIFGFGFLILSLLICGCIVHKLGMCRWNRRRYEEEVMAAQQQSHSEFNDFINVIDLPPSYDIVAQDPTKYDPPMFASISKPPPTYEMACSSSCCSKEGAANSSIPSVHHI